MGGGGEACASRDLSLAGSGSSLQLRTVSIATPPPPPDRGIQFPGWQLSTLPENPPMLPLSLPWIETGVWTRRFIGHGAIHSVLGLEGFSEELALNVVRLTGLHITGIAYQNWQWDSSILRIIRVSFRIILRYGRCRRIRVSDWESGTGCNTGIQFTTYNKRIPPEQSRRSRQQPAESPKRTRHHPHHSTHPQQRRTPTARSPPSPWSSPLSLYFHGRNHALQRRRHAVRALRRHSHAGAAWLQFLKAGRSYFLPVLACLDLRHRKHQPYVPYYTIPPPEPRGGY